VKNGLVLPTYPHDCVSCVYLGAFASSERAGEREKGGDVFDLYVCQAGAWNVVARYGADRNDCLSGLSCAHHSPALREAKRRAQAAGLLLSDKKATP